jgi:hypothetical protein
MKALSEWHLRGIGSSQAAIAEAISVAKELNDLQALALAQWFAAFLAHFECNPAEAERLASNLLELSTVQNFAFWLPGCKDLRGWARTAGGNAAEGILWIENGIQDWRATGAILCLPYWLSIKAEALHLAHRASEALETIKQAEVLAERFDERWWWAELQRLRSLFLTAIGAERSQIEASFCAAMATATQQKSISLARRAEQSYAEYRQQKAKKPS